LSFSGQEFLKPVQVAFPVLASLFGRKLRPCFAFAGRIADHGGEVADDQDGFVSEILKITEFAQDYRVAEVQVGA